MRGLVFAALVAVGAPLFGVGAAVLVSDAAGAAVVQSIVVQGNKRIDAESVRNYVTVRPGKNFGPADIDASVKVLYSTGLFADVRIAQRGNSLVVTVVENPVVFSVRFEGNKKYKTSNLANLIETQPRSMLSESKLESDARRIEEFYSHAGRANASVTTQVNNLSGENRVEVVFLVDEGGKTKISQIDFVGNDHFSDRRLRGVINTKKSNFLLGFLSKADIYDEAKLDADRELLRRFYLNHGYADVQILSVDTNFDAEKSRYYITFTVEEGPRYTFGNIEIDSSIPEISGESLRRYLHTRSGSSFNASAVDRTLEEITVAVSEQGYAFAQVRPRGDRNYDDHTIDLTYVIDEGARVYIERINIVGNERTRDYVIRREFDLAEGDPYNRVMIDAVERRLRGLGYFETVRITMEGGSAPDKVILTVNVTEKSTGELSAAGGYSTTDGFIAEISLTERNFLGRGQYVRIAAGGGLGGDSGTRTFDFKFIEPYFLGRRMPVGLEGYRREIGDSDLRPFDRESTGGSVWVGLPINDDLEFKVGYRILSDEVSSVSAAATPLYPAGTTLTSSVFYNFTFSTLDSKTDPTEGLRVTFEQEVAGAGGDTRFLRTTGQINYYRPIIPDTEIIGMLRASGGNITGLGQSVRVIDNFFKGGETVRGFASYGYGPFDTTSGLPTGGKNFWSATAEVQFPMPVIPEDFGVRGALFADAGMLFGVDDPASAFTIVGENTVRTSAGFSILWDSPFGLLRGDVGFPLTKAATDETQIFRFSAGTKF